MPVVPDADDPSVLHGEDVEDLPPEHHIIDRFQAGTSHPEDDVLSRWHELQGLEAADGGEASLQGAEHFVGAVAGPPLPEALPGDIGSEHAPGGSVVASPEGSEEVKEDEEGIGAELGGRLAAPAQEMPERDASSPIRISS